MPRDYTPDGRNLSPPLTWSNLPPATKEIAVVCEDPDAGNPPPFVHWVIYNIPATAKGLPEGIPIDPAAPMPAEIAGAIQGVSGFRRAIYRGPAPPPGKPHHYHFVVYALDADLGLKPGPDQGRSARRDQRPRHRPGRDRQHLRTEGHTMTFISRRDLLKRAAVVGAAAPHLPKSSRREGSGPAR